MVNSLPSGGVLLHFLLRSECFGANIPHVLVVVEGILGACMHLEVAALKGDIIGAILLGVTLILKPPLPGNGAQLVVLTLELGPGLFCAFDSPPQYRRGGWIGR